MSGRSGVRLAVGVLAALATAGATGCGSSRSFQPVPAYPPASSADSGRVIARAADKNPPGPIDNRYGPAASSSWPGDGRADGRAEGRADARGDRWGASRLPVTPGQTWPSPGPDVVRTGYGEELGDGQLTGQPAGIPLQRPPVQPLAYPGGGFEGIPAGATMPARGGPGGNVRQMPSAAGGMFELAPYETPMDRAVELARKIDQVNAENVRLLGRIRVLEKAAEDRETALNETLRDVQNASDEVTRTRLELQNVRKELAAVKARVLQVEQDEAETLKAIIAAIEKLLQQPMPVPMPPDSGKK